MENYSDLDNLDNEDELQPEETDETPEDSEEEEEGERKGNLGKALQEERRKSREARSQMKEMEDRLRRAESLIDAAGGRHQAPQVNPDEHRARLQAWMLERPDDFIGAIQKQTQDTMRMQMAPMLATQAEAIVMKDSRFSEAYSIPAVRDAVDSFVMNEIENGGITDFKDLKDVVTRTMEGVLQIRGAKADENPAKARASSTVGRGSGGNKGRSETDIWEDKKKLATTNRGEYLKWAGSAEGKRVLNSLLGQSRS